MPYILILGAHGQIARVATDLFSKQTDARLTLYLRNAKRLKLSGNADRVRVVEGDVLDMKTLELAMDGTTQKGEPFKNASEVVPRKSVADLVVKLATTPSLESRQSLGVHGES